MGRKKARSQQSRTSPSGQTSLAAKKRRILRSIYWSMDGLAFCRLHGRWTAWEQRLLDELPLGVSSDYRYAVMYSVEILNEPWPDIEPWLVGLMQAPDLVRMSAEDFWYFVEYVQCHNGSTTLQEEILARDSPVAAFAYAAYGTRRRWPDAEDLILSADTAESPALCMGVDDILSRSWKPPWESQAVTYARLFLKSGWPALEDKMSRGECHPQVAYEYAVNVLQGPLPQAISNWLKISTFDPGGAKYQQQYVAFETAMRAAQSSPGNPASSPIP